MYTPVLTVQLRMHAPGLLGAGRQLSLHTDRGGSTGPTRRLPGGLLRRGGPPRPQRMALGTSCSIPQAAGHGHHVAMMRSQ